MNDNHSLLTPFSAYLIACFFNIVQNRFFFETPMKLQPKQRPDAKRRHSKVAYIIPSLELQLPVLHVLRNITSEKAIDVGSENGYVK